TKLLAGEPDDLTDIELDLDGVPEFNRGVYEIARAIPPGKTLTYGDIAKQLGGVQLSRDVGQALGGSGTKLMTTLVHALHQRGKRYGLQTMCEGGGMANVTIVERL
ncbi:MGMT family protein, partial [Bradyrhizobium ottawaense]|uniref:MGMT family protein n=1 Tax=Bradyrhizobium ottawaense TaxID=931866 RepID=UPI0030C7115E